MATQIDKIQYYCNNGWLSHSTFAVMGDTVYNSVTVLVMNFICNVGFLPDSDMWHSRSECCQFSDFVARSADFFKFPSDKIYP